MEKSQAKSWLSDFSPRQKRIVTYGITSLAVCAIALLVAVTVVLGSKVIRIISPAISPLVLGLLLSFVLGHLFGKIPEKIRSFAYWAMWVLIALAVIFTMWGWGEKLMGQVDTLTEVIQKAFSSLMERLSKIMKRFPQIEKWSSEVPISAFITQFLMFFVSGFKKISTWGFAIFFGCCFLKTPLNADKIISQAREAPFLSLSDQTWKLIQEQLKGLVDMLTKYFPNQLLINIFEGLLGAIGLALLELPSGIVLGFLMGFMNIIPLVGTFMVLPIVLTVAFFCDGGSFFLAFLAFCVWAVVEVVDLILPPNVHGEKLNLPSGVIVFSFLFWGALIDPVWGMILAIPLTAFSMSFYRAVKEFLKSNNNKDGNIDKERIVQ